MRYISRCDIHQSSRLPLRLICVCLRHHDGTVNGQIEDEAKKLSERHPHISPRLSNRDRIVFDLRRVGGS